MAGLRIIGRIDMHQKWIMAACAAALGLASEGAVSPKRRTPVVEAVEKALPAVVNIGTEQLVKVVRNDPFSQFRGQAFDQLFEQFFRQVLPPRGTDMQVKHSLGSGAIIDPAGYILTNYHVIERASVIRVTLMDGRTFTARFLAGDQVNDLALIKIDAPDALPAIQFARDNDLLLGETVVALGNPFGLGHSVTVGVLSAKNREARYGEQVLFRDILQTDAAVNPGNSGGPLLNIDGDCIGVNVAIYQEAQNIGFAVPSLRARALLTQWLSPRALNKLVTGLDLEERDGRLRVTRVDPQGPSAGSGLKPGDVLIAVNGRAVPTLLDYDRALVNAKADDEVQVGYARGEQAGRAAFRLAALPRPDGARLALLRLGLGLGEARTDSRLRQGLPVREVRAGSPAERAGIRAGFFVTQINGMDISTLDDAGLALENVARGAVVPVVVMIVEDRENLLVTRVATARLQAE